MRAFVTGIEGFAGSHLAEYLLRSGHTVSGLAWTQAGLENLDSIRASVDLFRGDLMEPASLRSALGTANPEVVFHLAAMSSVGGSWADEDGVLQVNLEGTENLLRAMSELPLRPEILFAGTGESYGLVPETDQPISESTPMHPGNPYARSKTKAEEIVMSARDKYGLRVRPVRAFNHTGPRQSDAFVCPAFAKQIAEIERGGREPVLRVGNLEAKRDFSDVRDIVRGYVQVVERGREGVAYNLCSGRAIPVREILERLISLTPKEIEVAQDPERMRPSDHPILYGDFSRASRELDWKPEIALDQTLSDLLDFWRTRLQK